MLLLWKGVGWKRCKTIEKRKLNPQVEGGVGGILMQAQIWHQVKFRSKNSSLTGENKFGNQGSMCIFYHTCSPGCTLLPDSLCRDLGFIGFNTSLHFPPVQVAVRDFPYLTYAPVLKWHSVLYLVRSDCKNVLCGLLHKMLPYVHFTRPHML